MRTVMPSERQAKTVPLQCDVFGRCAPGRLRLRVRRGSCGSCRCHSARPEPVQGASEWPPTSQSDVSAGLTFNIKP